MSVIAVIITLEPTAGSRPSFTITIGIITPIIAAISRLSIMASVITPPSCGSSYSHQVMAPIIPPHTRPLIRATPISRRIRKVKLPGWICCSAIARTIMVIVWLPVLPPIPATIGISEASATSCEMVCSKPSMTLEAINAVHRLTASHAQRVFTALLTGAKTSSSSLRPPIRRRSLSVSS